MKEQGELMSEEQEKKEEILDVSDIFEGKLKRFRPFAILFLALIVVGMIAPFIMLVADVNENFIKYFLLILIFPLILAILPVWMVSKCPNCGKFMGRTTGFYCSNCGAKIRKDQSRK